MKTKNQRRVFWAIIVIGSVLPWLTILGAAFAFDKPLTEAFSPLTTLLPALPVTVVLLAAWWALPFVVLALLWRRLVASDWAPLHSNPLLMLLGVPVLVVSGFFPEPLGALYVIAFLAYGMATLPSWGLRSTVGRSVFAGFGIVAALLFTLLNYAFFFTLGGTHLRQPLVAPLGILNYSTIVLLAGYLLAKPIDLLVTRGAPKPELACKPKPSSWTIAGNALTCAAGLPAGVYLFMRLTSSPVLRHEVYEFLAGKPLATAFFGVVAGAILGIAVYLAVDALLHKGIYRHRNAVLEIGLALIPGLLLGLSPGLLGERAIVQLLGSTYFQMAGYAFGSIDAVAASPDGRRVAADADNRLLVWDAASARMILSAEYEPMDRWLGDQGLAWSPDSTTIAVASATSGIVLLDSRTGLEISSLEIPGRRQPGSNGVTALSFSPDGKRLAAALADGRIFVFDPAGGTLLHGWQCPVPARNLMAIAFSPDGRRLAMSGVGSAEAHPMAGFVAVIDAASGETLYAVDDFEQVANAIAFNRDGTRLMIAGIDNPPMILDAATGRPVVTLRQHCSVRDPALRMADTYYAAFTGAGDTVATACSSGVVDLCDAGTGECRLLVEFRLSRIHAIAAYPDGRHVFVVENGERATLWDTQTGEPRRVYYGLP